MDNMTALVSAFARAYHYRNNHTYPVLYSYCKYTNEPSIRTAESIGMHFDSDYLDEANGTTHVSVISKEDWLSEIGSTQHTEYSEIHEEYQVEKNICMRYA